MDHFESATLEKGLAIFKECLEEFESISDSLSIIAEEQQKQTVLLQRMLEPPKPKPAVGGRLRLGVAVPQ